MYQWNEPNATRVPPMILHNAIHKTQEPPCRLRASRLVTALNHLAVSGLLSRQAISGEMMSKMNAGTSVQ